MAQFPSMMSAENPYASGASEAMRAALDFAGQLRAEAAKGQQADQAATQKTLKEQFDTALTLQDKGYTRYDVTGADGKPTLAHPEGSDVASQSQLITDPWGRQWKMPDKADKSAATPQQTFTDTSELDKAGARPISGEGNVAQNTTVPRFRQDAQGNVSDTGMFGINGPVEDPSRVRTVPGSGQQFYMPTEGEKTAESGRAAAAKTKTEEDAKNFTLPDSVTAKWEQKAGVPAGSLKGLAVPRSEAVNVLKALADPSQKAPHIETQKDDSGNVTTIARDTESGKELWRTVDKGIGENKAKDRAAAQSDRDDARRQREADANQKIVDTLDSKREALSGQADQQRQLLNEYQRAIGTPNGTLFTDPLDKNRAQRPMNAGARTRMGEAYMRVKSKADGLDKQASTLGQQAEARRNGPQQAAGPSQPKPAAAPARQAAAPPETPATQPYRPAAAAGAAKGSKATTLARVRAYAKAQGISEAEAIRAAKGEGFSIAGLGH
jgi:hypothetical protein